MWALDIYRFDTMSLRWALDIYRFDAVSLMWALNIYCFDAVSLMWVLDLSLLHCEFDFGLGLIVLML